MHLSVPDLGLSGSEVVKVRQLSEHPAFVTGGNGTGPAQLRVVVSALAGATSRCAYQLSAE